jgi:hypothetical protein
MAIFEISIVVRPFFDRSITSTSLSVAENTVNNRCLIWLLYEGMDFATYATHFLTAIDVSNHHIFWFSMLFLIKTIQF